MAEQRFWLMKSEPTCYSIDDLARDRRTFWDGVRNYQARNFMRDDMKVGDAILFYHSNADPTGVAGLAKVIKTAYPDHTAWDRQNDHFDPKSTPLEPIWMMVDVAFVEKFPQTVTLQSMKENKSLEGMMVLQRGSRLSVQPVEAKHFQEVVRHGKGAKSPPARTRKAK
ncbi:EVE domain-containing protein [bacterium]|jgi:predicted RNA-binding protein with PUA-like domain|nr:EVE domain-containing protein [bacterium]